MNVTATATSPTMINVQWEHPPFMNTIDHYFVSWEPFGLPPAVTLGGGMMEINCVSANTPVLGTTNCTDVMEFNITGLEEYVNYTVMVIASNDVGNSTSGTDTALTLPDCEYKSMFYRKFFYSLHTYILIYHLSDHHVSNEFTNVYLFVQTNINLHACMCACMHSEPLIQHYMHVT